MAKLRLLIALVLCISCAGIERDCSSCCASSFGSDWIIVQYAASGEIIHCWVLKDTSVDNEHGSDGIYWKDSRSGNLMHLANFYNRVQVMNGRWDEGFAYLNMTKEDCEKINSTQKEEKE